MIKLVNLLIPIHFVRDLLVGEYGVITMALTYAIAIILPVVVTFFTLFGILEDSGYLARAALIADRTMAKVGLQGKSFIPLLSAYGCAVPAILATRTIESRRDRIATILIAPFMTCSARLPIYTLVIAAFIPSRSLVGNFVTSLDMAGCSVTLLRASDELLHLWDAPVRTPALRWGI